MYIHILSCLFSIRSHREKTHTTSMDKKVPVDYIDSFVCSSDRTIDVFSAKWNMVSTNTSTVCTSDSVVISYRCINYIIIICSKHFARDQPIMLYFYLAAVLINFIYCAHVKDCP